jgi:branched-chain amino acid transport system permease protein
MALGVNMQWGYAGLFNVGVMGFVALGGLAVGADLDAATSTTGQAGGPGICWALDPGRGHMVAAMLVAWRMAPGRACPCAGGGGGPDRRASSSSARSLTRPTAVEAINPVRRQYRRAWPADRCCPGRSVALLAAVSAWGIGKTALGLRSDYLAIATLGIAEIIIAVMKNEDWLARGVKNVIGLPRPVPYEVDLQATRPSWTGRSWLGT